LQSGIHRFRGSGLFATVLTATFENVHRGFSTTFIFKTSYIHNFEERIELLRKTVSGIMLTLLLVSMLTLAFNIQSVKANGTIYIRANGSIDPPTAPISSCKILNTT